MEGEERIRSVLWDVFGIFVRFEFFTKKGDSFHKQKKILKNKGSSNPGLQGAVWQG